MKRKTKSIMVPVPLELLKRLVPLIIEGNNSAIEGMCDLKSDSDSEMELEQIIEDFERSLKKERK